MTEEAQPESTQPQLSIKGYYVRHLSLETSLSPVSMPLKQPPEMRLEVRIQINPLDEQDEVVLELTLSAREGSNLLYLMKIHQAGCFLLKNFTTEQKAFFLNTTCANLLYPYANQLVNSLAVQAGFPPANLLPMDFTHIYQQQQQAQAAQGNSAGLESASEAPTSTVNKWANFATETQNELNRSGIPAENDEGCIG